MAYFTKQQVDKLVSGKNMPGYSGALRDSEEEGFRGQLPAILHAVAQRLLSKQAAGLRSPQSGYAYYPKNRELTLWSSSDDIGGKGFKATLLEIMSEYLGILNIEFMVYPDDLPDSWFVKKVRDQADFEGDQIVGDSMNIEKAIDKLLGEALDPSLDTADLAMRVLTCVTPGRLEVVQGEERSAEAKEGDEFIIKRSDEWRVYGNLRTKGAQFVRDPGLSGNRVNRSIVNPSTVECAVLRKYVDSDISDFWATWELLEDVEEAIDKQLGEAKPRPGEPGYDTDFDKDEEENIRKQARAAHGDFQGANNPERARKYPGEDGRGEEGVYRGGFSSAVKSVNITDTSLSVIIDGSADLAEPVTFTVDLATGKISADSAMNKTGAYLVLCLLRAAGEIGEDEASEIAAELG
jgi:hypothetical protein